MYVTKVKGQLIEILHTKTRLDYRVSTSDSQTLEFCIEDEASH